MSKTNHEINDIDRQIIIDKLTDELTVLRAEMAISQEELSDLLYFSSDLFCD